MKISEASIKPKFSSIINDKDEETLKIIEQTNLLMTIKQKRRLKIADTLAALLATAGLAIQYYLTQILFYGSPKYTITYQYNTLCYINLTLTIFLRNLHLVTCIAFHYSISIKLSALKKSSLESEGFKSGMLRSLLLELAICSITSLPNVNVEFTGSMLGGTYIYHLTDIFMIIMLLRCYLILRLYEHYSKWTSFKSYSICKKYGVSADAFFALKSDLKDRPFLTLAIVITLLVVIFGVATLQSEKSFSNGSMSGIDQLTNAEWLIIITMTTVGYGDFYPLTHLGRFFCLLACISGMVLVSAMIVALSVSSQFTKDQSIAYLAIRTKMRQEEYFASAANVVKSALRLARNRKNLVMRYKSIMRLRKTVHCFKRNTQLNSLMDISSAEMLYDLQHKLEEKLLATKSIICDIPNLEQRCINMRTTQRTLDEKMERIIAQQRIISNQLDRTLTN